jgi:hypothetical protein
METDMRLINEKLTLCEVIRTVNDRFQGDDETSGEIRDLLCLGLFMAKRMAKKLREYNEKWDADWVWSNPRYWDIIIRKENTYKVGSKEQALKTLEKIGKRNENITDTVSE